MHRILCVDDERSVLQALRRLFMDEADFDVRLAGDGPQALALMEEAAPDLIVSDYRMPAMNGAEFLKRAKTLHPDAVRIILSGYADASVIVSLINEGEIYKFIPKPWDDNEMLITIRRALEQHDLQIENKRLAAELVQRNEELRGMNEDLERRVNQRTGELLFKNHAFQTAKNILDQIAIGIVGLSDDGTIVQANQMACMLLGGGGSLIGGNLHEMLPPELAALAEEEAGDLTAKEMSFAYRKALAGNYGGYHAICLPLRNGGERCGTIVQFVAATPEPLPANGKG